MMREVLKDKLKILYPDGEKYLLESNRARGQSITFVISDPGGNKFAIAKFFDFLKGTKEVFVKDIIVGYENLDALINDLDNAVNPLSNCNLDHISLIIDVQKRSFTRYVKIAKNPNLHCFPKVFYSEEELKIDNSFYGLLIEEFVKGVTLEERLEKNIENKELFVIDFLNQMSAQLTELSDNNIVHRDLSPDNIMIRDGKYILIDPGVAKIDDGNLTRTIGMQMGKIYYASPEQYIGRAKFVTFKSDLYSIGIMALEIILGYNPLGEIISKNIYDNPHDELQNQMERELEDKIYDCIEETKYSRRMILIIGKLIQVNDISRFDTLSSFKLALSMLEGMEKV